MKKFLTMICMVLMIMVSMVSGVFAWGNDWNNDPWGNRDQWGSSLEDPTFRSLPNAVDDIPRFLKQREENVERLINDPRNKNLENEMKRESCQSRCMRLSDPRDISACMDSCDTLYPIY